MKKYPRHIAGLLFLMVLVCRTLAQDSGADRNTVSVRAAIDHPKILVGQPLRLTLEASMPPGTAFTWYPLDSIPHFEWLDKGAVDSVITPDGVTYRQTVRLTSFDSGRWAIPALPLVIGNNQYLTDSISVNIGFSKFDANQDYHDIKDVIDVENPYARWIPWIVALITLLSIAGIFFFLGRKKQKAAGPAPPPPPLPPYEDALRLLGELHSEHLPEKGLVKVYYTRLNDILKMYVLRQLKIASLVKTNEELIGQLKELDLSREQFSQLAEALRISDSVKFAKYLPGEEDNEHNFRIIKSSIEMLNAAQNPSPAPAQAPASSGVTSNSIPSSHQNTPK